MSFSEEDIKVVGISSNEPNIGRIEVNRGRFRRVDPTQINNESIVDENPQIVIPSELESLSSLVEKGSVQLHGKVVVFVILEVAPSSVVDGIKVIAPEGINIRRAPTTCVGEGDIHREGLSHIWGIQIHLEEPVRRGNGRMTTGVIVSHFTARHHQIR